MFALIAYYWLWMILAFLIGLATAWWIWGQRQRKPASRRAAPDELIDWAPPESRATGSAGEAAARNDLQPNLRCDPDAPIAEESMPPAPPSAAPEAAGTPDKAPDEPDDLTRLKGIGPQLHALLLGLGISRFDQIARWSASDIERIDSELGVFRGRIARDEWVAQAQLLQAGDLEGFQARFGRS